MLNYKSPNLNSHNLIIIILKLNMNIVYIYRKIIPQVHVTGPAMHKYEMLFFLNLDVNSYT